MLVKKFELVSRDTFIDTLFAVENKFNRNGSPHTLTKWTIFRIQDWYLNMPPCICI